MKSAILKFEEELNAIREAGTWRSERIITTPQRSRIDTTEKRAVVNAVSSFGARKVYFMETPKAAALGWTYRTELEDGIRLAYDDFLNNPMRAER